MYAQSEHRLPAEWEDHRVILMAWPHAATDWEPMLAEAQECYVRIIEAIARFETVLLISPDPAEPMARLAHIDPERIVFAAVPTNDTWTRDYGPITIADGDSLFPADFVFNGWGMKFPANLDNEVNRRLRSAGILRALRNRRNMVLEGGSIESNGCGAIMTTSQCLYEFNRNSGMTEAEIIERLSDILGARADMLVLDHGSISGDDTDGHIDTLARFADPQTILYVAPPADSADADHRGLSLMERELRAKWPYKLVALPFAGPVYDPDDGSRLPATYANFLITPTAVIVPTYGLATDAEALATIGSCFPGRECVGVDCRALIRQHGSLHCATMQLYGSTLNLDASSIRRL